MSKKFYEYGPNDKPDLSDALSGKGFDLGTNRNATLALKALLESFGATVTGIGSAIDTSDSSSDTVSTLATLTGGNTDSGSFEQVAEALGSAISDNETVSTFIETLN